MPWSELPLFFAKYADETGTSELHRTSIMLAAIELAKNRSKYPTDLRGKPREKV